MSDDRFQQIRLLEAMIFASAEPVPEAGLAARLATGADVAGLLEELGGLYANRGVNLVRVDGKWAFRTATDLGPRLQIEQNVHRRLSRAALETLAVIAYHQPVTRAEIEEVRGVPGPFPLAVGDNWLGRLMLAVNRLLIRLSRGLFSYQIFMIAKPLPSLEWLLRSAVNAREERVGREQR